MRVLIVEDEALVSMMLEDYLIDLGHDIVASVPSVAEALEEIERGSVEVAILDVNLSGETAYPIADVLLNRGVRYAFATGYGILGVDPIYRSVPVLQKPFNESSLDSVMKQLGNISIMAE